MLINSLEAMETVVENNKSLSWDGWTVIESKKSPTAWMNKEGTFVNGTWILQKRFEPSMNGWKIPNKFASENEQKR